MRKNYTTIASAVTKFGTDPGTTVVSLLHALVHESPPGSVLGGAFDAGQNYRS
ncbi:hypothetical protein HRbin30_02663 [bacterium HR30]|nr:hypothetical protein HRbin30_02663 [bacterium HR30]